jgi:tetratricopeptide (TPR) repeat protein
VVLQNLAFSWYPKWHYAVVVGFDLARDEMVLRSGLERRHVVPFAVFERTWRRGDYWAVVVMPPDRLPHTALETSYLQAVVGLERLQRWEDAARAYRAAAARWPESLGAQLGIGNSRYALKDIAGAERAYRAAAAAHPESGIAFNNLAQALADQGRWREAEDAVTRALTFETTAAEIRGKKNTTADKRE